MIGRDVGIWLSAFFLPNEKALPAALREAIPEDSGVGGAAIVKACFRAGRSSKAMSVDDGRVDEELNRAEEEELS